MSLRFSVSQTVTSKKILEMSNYVLILSIFSHYKNYEFPIEFIFV